MPCDRKRGSNVHKMKYRKFHLNIRRHFFTVIEAKHFRNRLPSKSVESPSLKIVQSWATCCSWPSLEEGDGLDICRGPYQPQLLCNSTMWKLRIFHFQDYHRQHQHWIFIVAEPTENNTHIRKHSSGIPIKILLLRNFVNSTALVVWYFMKWWLASCLILYFHIFLVNAKLSLSWIMLFRLSFNNSLQTWYKAHIVKAHI